ncbi:MAG: hypothetical protein JSV33_02295, partial [bacterium]
EMRTKYEEEFQVASRIKLQELANKTQELTQHLEASKLDLLSLEDFSIIPFNQYVTRDEQGRQAVVWSRVGGVIISIFLLSLGAPFWFNALRSMSALRPVLAGKVDPSKNGP